MTSDDGASADETQILSASSVAENSNLTFGIDVSKYQGHIKLSLIHIFDWCFNASGGKVDGLYADWTKDDRVADLFCNKAGYDMYDAHPFVLELSLIHI